MTLLIVRLIFSALFLISAAVFGVYFGVWWALIGGSFDLINYIKSGEINQIYFGVSVLKILFFAVIGCVAAFPFVFLSLCISDGKIPSIKIIYKNK